MLELIFCKDSSAPKITLVLPEVKKGEEAPVHAGLTAEECREKMEEFHKRINDEKGDDAITSDEIRITLTSDYVPNAMILDIPGLSLHGSKVDKISNRILNKYFNGDKPYNRVDPLLCLTALCTTQVDGFMTETKNLIKKKDKANILSNHPIVVVTKIDEVSGLWLLILNLNNKVCLTPVTLPVNRAKTIYGRPD